MSNLEKEIGVIKGMYEKELDNLRRELEAAVVDRQKYMLSAQSSSAALAELQGRSREGQSQSAVLTEELASVRNLLSTRDAELNQMTAQFKDLSQRLSILQRDYQSMSADYDGLKATYGEVQLALATAQETIASLHGKLDFQNKIYAEEIAELKDRLQAESQQLIEFETKARQRPQATDNINSILAKFREKTEAELQQYKVESESRYTQNLDELQVLIDQYAANLAKATEDNRILSGYIEDYKTQLSSLQAKIRSLESENSALSQNVQQERDKSSAQVRALESKVEELQRTLIVKLKEIGNGLDQPLWSEIEALKALITDEDNKLQSMLTSQQYTSRVSSFGQGGSKSRYPSTVTMPMISDANTGYSRHIVGMTHARVPLVSTLKDSSLTIARQSNITGLAGATSGLKLGTGTLEACSDSKPDIKTTTSTKRSGVISGSNPNQLQTGYIRMLPRLTTSLSPKR
ncbi:prelamin-A/C-like [Ptychodera flava]|uniref:prelamin-A/C-like n=1 Tax=Ptychodera flava TaxID=63121 RepID=UPI003969F216